MNKERLQKLVSNYGNYSRRQVDRLISEGKVKVNDEIAVLGEKATIDDKIEIDGKIVKFNLKHEYFLLNKPKSYICSREDKFGKQTISLINNSANRNLFTVGRLDVNTTGLIIITTDGELSNIVMSPKSSIKKTYLAWIDKPLNKEAIIGLQKGTKLDDGYVTKPIKGFKIISNTSEKTLIKMTLTEGKKNQIKRMFKAYDRKVVNLKRTQIGIHKLDGIDTGLYKKIPKQKMYEGLGIEFQ